MLKCGRNATYGQFGCDESAERVDEALPWARLYTRRDLTPTECRRMLLALDVQDGMLFNKGYSRHFPAPWIYSLSP